MKEIKIALLSYFCEHVNKIQGIWANDSRDRFKKTNDGLCIYRGVYPIVQNRLFISDAPDYIINTRNVYSLFNDSMFQDGYQIGNYMCKHDIQTHNIINPEQASEEFLINHLNYVRGYIAKNKEWECNRKTLVEFEAKFNFLIMLSQDENISREDYIKEYNMKYSTNFEIVEHALFEEHMEMAVISISKGSFQDLFYLGYFIALKSFKQKLIIRKIIK